MNNWTVSKRITAGFAILSLITISVAFVGFIGLRMIRVRAEELVRDNMPSALILGQVKDNLSRGYANLETYIRTPDESKKKSILSIYEGLSKSNTELITIRGNDLQHGGTRASTSLLEQEKSMRGRWNSFCLVKAEDTGAVYAFWTRLSSGYANTGTDRHSFAHQPRAKPGNGAAHRIGHLAGDVIGNRIAKCLILGFYAPGFHRSISVFLNRAITSIERVRPGGLCSSQVSPRAACWRGRERAGASLEKRAPRWRK
jgi:hypothetical protein